MKDGLDVAAIRRIKKVFVAVYPEFRGIAFTKVAVAGIQGLELKQRVNLIIGLLAEYLPDNYEEACHLFEQIPAHWDAGVDGDPLRSFAAWPIIDYVGRYGENNPTRALEILYLSRLRILRLECVDFAEWLGVKA